MKSPGGDSSLQKKTIGAFDRPERPTREFLKQLEKVSAALLHCCNHELEE